MAKTDWTDEAQRWLRDIFDYNASDKPEAAAKVIGDIYQRPQVLIQSPGKRGPYPSFTKLNSYLKLLKNALSEAANDLTAAAHPHCESLEKASQSSDIYAGRLVCATWALFAATRGTLVLRSGERNP